MRGLTLIQPYGSAIIHWGKPVEHRSWAPPDALLGERIAIHAGKKLDVDAFADLVLAGLLPDLEDLPRGVVIGTVCVVGWMHTDTERRVEKSMMVSGYEPEAFAESPWLNPGGITWCLASPRALATPIPHKGMLGLWTVPDDVLAQMQAQLGGAL